MVPSHTAGQPRGPTPGRDRSEIEFRQADARSLLGRQPEMATERDLESTTQAMTTEDRDHGLRKILDGLDDLQTLIEKRFCAALLLDSLRQLFQVHPDGEILASRATQDDGAHGRIPGDPIHLDLEGIHELQGQAIVRGIVDEDRFDGTPSLDSQRGTRPL